MSQRLSDDSTDAWLFKESFFSATDETFRK